MSRREKDRVNAPAMSVGHDRSTGCSGCGLRLFFGIFAVAGLVMLYFMAIRPLWGVYSARSWEEAPCTVLSSEVERHAGDDSDTFSIEITYQYTFNGQQHTGDRYDFLDMSSSGRRSKQAVVNAHPVGHQTICYVNPDEPTDAVLNRDMSWDFLFGLLSLPFLVVGFGGLFFFKHKSSGSSTDAETIGNAGNAGIAAAETDGFGLFDNPDDDGPVTLESSTTPGCAFGGAVGVCLFWNGIVSVFAYQVIDDWQRGNPDWFLTIFLIPFVLIGLGIVVGVIYTFIALFNPHPTLTLTRRRIPLGGFAQVSWRFRGNAGAIRHLTITLKGVEKATYRRGTTTHTDESLFYEQVIFESDQAFDIHSGEADIDVPSDSMHTFEAGSNEIVWSLHVAGDIPLRPDVNAAFPIIVSPLEGYDL